MLIKIISGPFSIMIMILLVASLQYFLLYDSLTLGFKPDDWILYFNYKLLGSDPLSKISYVWSQRGLYTTYQVYYMGLLDSLFGLNYYIFHLSSLILKIIAILGLYPLIRIFFKSRLLAYLVVFLFSISHSAVGPLEFVVKGSDYLAIIWMEAFLLAYYWIQNNKFLSWRYYFILPIFFILAFSFSPIRMFPLLAIPFLTEVFLILRNFHPITIRKSLVKLSIIYSPFIIAFILMKPASLLADAYGPNGILKKVLDGNWYLLLAPFSGMGYSFITNDYWREIFGLIMADNLKNYLNFLLGGPTVICGMLTTFVVWSQIQRHKILFIVSTMLLNFLFQILIYFVAFHHRKLPFLQVNYDPVNLYSIIFGGYIIIIGFMIFLNWLKSKEKDRLSMAFWMGSAFLFVFTYLTWAFAPLGTGFRDTSYYLVVGSMGSSLMIGAFLVSFYNKLKSMTGRLGFLAFVVFLILIPIFKMSGQEILQSYSSLNRDGRGANGQIVMQKEARRMLADFKAGDYILVYFDTSDITGLGPFYSEGFLTSFPFFMLLQNGKVIDGCIGVIYEDNRMVQLIKSIQIQNGITGFSFPASCVDNGRIRSKDLFFTFDHFYAFRIKDKKLINIKEEVLKDLRFYN